MAILRLNYNEFSVNVEFSTHSLAPTTLLTGFNTVKLSQTA